MSRTIVHTNTIAVAGDYIRKYDYILSDTGVTMYTIIVWNDGLWFDIFYNSDVMSKEGRDRCFDDMCKGIDFLLENMFVGVVNPQPEPPNMTDHRFGESSIFSSW